MDAACVISPASSTQRCGVEGVVFVSVGEIIFAGITIHEGIVGRSKNGEVNLEGNEDSSLTVPSPGS